MISRLLVLALSPALLAASGSPDGGSSPIASEPSEPEASLVSDGASAPDSEGAGESSFDWVKWAEGWLSPQTITTVTAVLGFLGVIVKMAGELKRMAKDKQLTVERVQELVLGQMKESLPADVSAEFEKYLPKLVTYADKTNRILEVFAKILALSQEDTAESRLAILDLIQQMGVISNEVVEEAKEEVKSQQKAKEDAEKARKESVAEEIEKTEDRGDGTSI